MSTTEFRFNDGAAYAAYMGVWSQLAGRVFIDWMQPEPGWRWLDVGCGNGAFSELVLEHCAPAALVGVDPSPEQVAYAAASLGSPQATFALGDAMALAYPDASFDAAVMPLVIFFVPEPAQGVAELRRVVRSGGLVAAYAWDLLGGGFPYLGLRAAMLELGAEIPWPPSPEAANLENLSELWRAAGLVNVQTRAITVERVFADFDTFWSIVLGGPSVGTQLAAMTENQIATLKAQLRERLNFDAEGRIHAAARANAVCAYVP